MGKPNVALNYMYEAVQSEIKNGAPPETIACTKLNFCAILSNLGKHQQAIKQADDAIFLLEKTLQRLSPKKKDPEKLSPRNQLALDNDQRRILSSLAIAFFNKATEHEFLNQIKEAQELYDHGLQKAFQTNSSFLI